MTGPRPAPGDWHATILARLTVLETIATHAQPGPWHVGPALDPTATHGITTRTGGRPVAGGLRVADAEHVAAHHPGTVLAALAGRRRILQRHVPQYVYGWVGCHMDGYSWPCADYLDAAADLAADLPSPARPA